MKINPIQINDRHVYPVTLAFPPPDLLPPRPLIAPQRDAVQQVRQLPHVLGRRVLLRRREHAHQRPRRQVVVRPVRRAAAVLLLAVPLRLVPDPVEFTFNAILVSVNSDNST